MPERYDAVRRPLRVGSQMLEEEGPHLRYGVSARDDEPYGNSPSMSRSPAMTEISRSLPSSPLEHEPLVMNLAAVHGERRMGSSTRELMYDTTSRQKAEYAFSCGRMYRAYADSEPSDGRRISSRRPAQNASTSRSTVPTRACISGVWMNRSW